MPLTGQPSGRAIDVRQRVARHPFFSSGECSLLCFHRGASCRGRGAAEHGRPGMERRPGAEGWRLCWGGLGQGGSMQGGRGYCPNEN